MLRSFAASGGNEADDIHDDFKPQFKEQRSGSVEEAIRHDVSTNRVLLYMKVCHLLRQMLDCPHGVRLCNSAEACWHSSRFLLIVLVCTQQSPHHCSCSSVRCAAASKQHKTLRSPPCMSVHRICADWQAGFGLLHCVQGDPEAPMCGFSNMACQILNAYGAGIGIVPFAHPHRGHNLSVMLQHHAFEHQAVAQGFCLC